MSNLNRSLVLEEMKQTEAVLEALLPARSQPVNQVSKELQLAHQVVKVSGTITISF